MWNVDALLMTDVVQVMVGKRSGSRDSRALAEGRRVNVNGKSHITHEHLAALAIIHLYLVIVVLRASPLIHPQS